jgi:hypothetical protein
MNEAQFDPDGAPTMKEFIELRNQAFRTDERLTRVDERLTRVTATVARIEGDLFEVKRDVSELKGLHSKFDRFQTVLDGMARQMESFERWCRFQGNMLVEHEGPIAKLELKPE